jgi:hypothetical protein
MFRSLLSWLSIAVSFGFLSLPAVQAQSLEESLPAGARVRVTLASETDPAGTGGPRLVGRLAEARPGSIMLTTSRSETRELRRDTIVRLERSIRPSRKKRGALIGFGAGFITWFPLCVLVSEGEHTSACGLGSAILALPTAGVGAWVAPGEQWADVPLGARTCGVEARRTGLRLRLVPLVGRRSGLAVSASF